MPKVALEPSREECLEADRHPAATPAAQGQAVSGEAERHTARAALQRCCRDPRTPGSRGNRRGFGGCLGYPGLWTIDRPPRRSVCRSYCRWCDPTLPPAACAWAIIGHGTCSAMPSSASHKMSRCANDILCRKNGWLIMVASCRLKGRFGRDSVGTGCDIESHALPLDRSSRWSSSQMAPALA